MSILCLFFRLHIPLSGFQMTGGIGNDDHKHLQFTFDVSTSPVIFLDTIVYKGHRFQHCSKLDIKSLITPTNSF